MKREIERERELDSQKWSRLENARVVLPLYILRSTHRLLKMIITISLSETPLILFVLCSFSSLLIDLRWPRVYEGHYQVNIKQLCSPFWKRIVGYR